MPQDGDIAPAGEEFVAPPPPRQPRTHTSPTIIQMLKGLSLASKLQRNKKIEAKNNNRAAKSLDHEQDPEAHPEPRSETASLITIDPKDLNRLKVPAIVATFREWIYPSLSVFLADEDVKEKVKRKLPLVLVLWHQMTSRRRRKLGFRKGAAWMAAHMSQELSGLLCPSIS